MGLAASLVLWLAINVTDHRQLPVRHAHQRTQLRGRRFRGPGAYMAGVAAVQLEWPFLLPWRPAPCSPAW